MTLRMDRQLAEELDGMAYSLKLSKAAFIRRSLRLAVESARHQNWQAHIRSKEE